jgi:hypothetical protein
VAERLPRKCEALNSNPLSPKRKKRKKERKKKYGLARNINNSSEIMEIHLYQSVDWVLLLYLDKNCE